VLKRSLSAARISRERTTGDFFFFFFVSKTVTFRYCAIATSAPPPFHISHLAVTVAGHLIHRISEILHVPWQHRARSPGHRVSFGLPTLTAQHGYSDAKQPVADTPSY